ncbi:unnamed protein product [Lampetra planeri]
MQRLLRKFDPNTPSCCFPVQNDAEKTTKGDAAPCLLLFKVIDFRSEVFAGCVGKEQQLIGKPVQQHYYVKRCLRETPPFPSASRVAAARGAAPTWSGNLQLGPAWPGTPAHADRGVVSRAMLFSLQPSGVTSGVV